MKVVDAHVVVTGGSRGIGEAVARRFAEQGASVTVVARNRERLEAVASETGGTAVAADLLVPEQRRGLIAAVEEAAGPVDVLVNNAGVDEVGDFLGKDADAVERVFTLNGIATVELSRQALPGMIERGRGHIVNVSSLAGTAVLPGTAVYSATKAALTHFTSGLRLELRGLPIGLTSVEMGVVHTDMGDSVEAHPPFKRAYDRYCRLGLARHHEVEEIARAVVWAVQKDKRHVRLPKRSWLYPAIAGTPRRINELILSGVPRRATA